MTDYLNLAPGEQQFVWETFVSSEPGSPDEDEAFRRAERLLRPEIYNSWLYSKQKGIDPFKVKNRRLPVEKLSEVLKENRRLISISIPYMEEFLQFFDSEHYAISVTDSNGIMLALMGGMGDVIKDTMLTEKLEIGTERSEDYSGTNGISVCLRHRKPVQIIGPEHYIRSQQLYTSSAAPIFSPGGDLIGCFNVFGPSEMVHPHTLGMVVTAANGMSKELQLSQSYSAMRLTSSRMAIMLELSNSGIIMADHDHIIRNHNMLAERILGLAAGEIDGRPLPEVLVTDTSVVDFTALSSDFIDREISFRIKGRSVDLNVAATTIRNSDGSSGGIVITLDEMKQIRNIVKQAGGFTARYTLDSIIGDSAPVMECKKLCRTASRSVSNVLILGESGTGKELFAHAIHNGSDRKNGPFIAINCASIPKDLIESELFGYEGNAFTGASRNGQPGKFELADGGTIFLDEIGDMPLNLQTSLLRILQSGEVTRVGGKTSKPVDVRVIAATNHDLRADAARHDFRQDLYYRLNVLSFTIPPLRKRRGDIGALVEHFISSYSGQLCKDVQGVTPEAMKLLTGYLWPGNVRELENVIERCVNLAPDMYIGVYDLPEEIRMQNAWQGNMPGAGLSGAGVRGAILSDAEAGVYGVHSVRFPATNPSAPGISGMENPGIAGIPGSGAVFYGAGVSGSGSGTFGIHSAWGSGAGLNRAGDDAHNAGLAGTESGVQGTRLSGAVAGVHTHMPGRTAGVDTPLQAGYDGTAGQPFCFASGGAVCAPDCSTGSHWFSPDTGYPNHAGCPEVPAAAASPTGTRPGAQVHPAAPCNDDTSAGTAATCSETPAHPTSTQNHDVAASQMPPCNHDPMTGAPADGAMMPGNASQAGMFCETWHDDCFSSGTPIPYDNSRSERYTPDDACPNASSACFRSAASRYPGSTQPAASQAGGIAADHHRYTMKDSERHMICSALARTAGNIQRASELRGISRRTMYNKIERYGIDIAAYRAVPPTREKLR